MSEKKNIDRLFQEKLKDFEVTPRDTVWQNIAALVQPKKKKRRVVPLWIRLSGVAAGLLLLVSLGNTLFFSDDATLPVENNPIVNENATPNQELPGEPESVEALTSTDTSTIDNSSNNTPPEQEKAVVNNKNTPKSQLTNTSKKALQLKTDEARVVMTDEVDKSKNAKDIISTTDIAETQTDKIEEAANESEQNSIEETNTASILDALTNTEEEEAFAEKDEISKSSRWSISPNLAPVYFNSLGEGSSIHSDFNSNPKSGDVNMSYGITASYALNDKLRVRAGVNKVQLGYSTNEILVFNSVSSSIRSSKYRNIDLNRTANDISFASAESIDFSQAPLFINGKNASIDQQLGFLEVPLELEYKLLDKKLGLHVVGGFSALFLESNDLYSVLDGQNTLIGKATNINKTSYSANLGLGLGYKMSNKLNLNLEPVFKYQLNTFTNTSGDFRPYFIGFYTGLSFKF